MAHILLRIPYTDEQIKRYDLMRHSFKYNTDEYDIKIESTVKKEIEIRSSIIRCTIEECISNYGIICSYTNIVKKFEKQKDLYCGVSYFLNKKDDETSLVEQVYKGEVKILLLSIANEEDEKKYGIINNLKQKNTSYRIVKYLSIGDFNNTYHKFKI